MTIDRRGLLLVGAAIAGATIAAPLLPASCSKRREGEAMSKRPDGNPKPALSEDMAPLLARLQHWLDAHPEVPVTINPPAKDADLLRLETTIGRKLPASFHHLYRWHDGEQLGKSSWGFLFGTEWLSLAGIEQAWLDWKKTEAYFGGNRYPLPGDGWPKGAVDPAYTNPGWVAFAADGSGNHIGVDLDPWPEGRIGQIILFGRDQDVKAVISPSLDSFFGWFVDQLEAGHWHVEQRGQTPQISLRGVKDFDLFGKLREIAGAPGQFL